MSMSLSEESALLPKAGGISVPTTAVMIAGTIAGSGILALPAAMENTGVTGAVLLLLLGIMAAYTGLILGWSWTLLENRHNLISHTQDPYSVLGKNALGHVGHIVVQICVYFISIGGGAVFLLLAADLLSDLIRTLGKTDISLCYIALLLGLLFIPMNWLGTPVDFWPMGIVALLSTAGACVLVDGYMIYLSYENYQVTHAPIQADKFITALGSMAFTLTGHTGFPSIQQDMANREKFGTAVAIAFAMVIVMYLLITLPSFLLLGDITGPNILTTLASIRPGWPVTAAEFLLLLHLITAYLIILTPVNQDLEKLFNIPNKFGLKRVILRTTVIGFIIFLSESIPSFGILLSLVGGSAITMITYILPVFMYESLRRGDAQVAQSSVPWYQRVLHFIIVIVGVFIMVCSTYFSLTEIVALNYGGFVAPCYINISAVHI